MKYIRTKDSRVYEENKLYFEPLIEEYISIKDPHTRVGEIDFGADTIEELCDAFVVYEENTGKHFICEKFNEYKEQVICCRNKCVYYGAIWTDKGLIYVAKMNEKRELELI